MMNKNEVKEMNVLQVEESLLAVTRIYIRMHCTSIPATDTEKKNAKELIQSLAKDVIEWAEIYSSLFEDNSIDDAEDSK